MNTENVLLCVVVAWHLEKGVNVFPARVDMNSIRQCLNNYITR